MNDAATADPSALAVRLAGVHKWFGSFHDGTDASQEAMNKRFMERHAKVTQS